MRAPFRLFAISSAVVIAALVVGYLVTSLREVNRRRDSILGELQAKGYQADLRFRNCDWDVGFRNRSVVFNAVIAEAPGWTIAFYDQRDGLNYVHGGLGSQMIKGHGAVPVSVTWPISDLKSRE